MAKGNPELWRLFTRNGRNRVGETSVTVIFNYKSK